MNRSYVTFRMRRLQGGPRRQSQIAVSKSKPRELVAKNANEIPEPEILLRHSVDWNQLLSVSVRYRRAWKKRPSGDTPGSNQAQLTECTTRRAVQGMQFKVKR